MAYGNYAPFYRTGYFNTMPPQMMQPQTMGDNQQQFGQQYGQPVAPMQMQPTNDMIWVLNETEATSYPVAPNNSVTLWDKNQDTVYIKSVNVQGVPSMRVLDYKERTADVAPKSAEHHECKCGSKFVAKEDFSELHEEVQLLREEIEEYKAKSKAKTGKATKAEEEHDG